MSGALRVMPVADGLVLQLSGRCSVREAAALSAFVEAEGDALATARIRCDLSACTYLDSTMLGALIGLHQRLAGRFALVAPHDAARESLQSTQLIRLFAVEEQAPPATGPATELDLAALDADAFGREILAAHRRLAAIGGPQQAAFRAVAERMAAEIGEAHDGG
ncbi:MAG: STAS domain-containing protein [Planctomycetota bacterium]